MSPRETKSANDLALERTDLAAERAMRDADRSMPGDTAPSHLGRSLTGGADSAFREF